MTEALIRLLWLIPASFIVGLIYAALRSGSLREFARQGVRQSFSILVGMAVLGLIIYWMSRYT